MNLEQSIHSALFDRPSLHRSAAVDDGAAFGRTCDRDGVRDGVVTGYGSVVIDGNGMELEGTRNLEIDRVVAGARIRLQDRGAQRALVSVPAPRRANAVAGVGIGQVGRAVDRERPGGGGS